MKKATGKFLIQENVSLNQFSYYKIGGPARYFLAVSDFSELFAGLRDWQKIKAKLAPAARKEFIIGGATNLLIADEGFDGLIIHNNIKFVNSLGRNWFEFGAGLLVSEAIDFCLSNSLSGFEWAGGLPGTVGGAVRGNAGAFGGEIKDNIIEVKSFDLKAGIKRERNCQDCHFDYRNSIFKDGEGRGEIIISAVFCFSAGEQSEIKKAITTKIDYRQSHQPLEYPNAGSTFKNVDARGFSDKVMKKFKNVIKYDPFPVIPAAHLLSEARLKGKRIGCAEISKKHPNFIINLGGAKASDVLALIKIAQKKVREEFQISLQPEIILVRK